jgi:asparagine synthase (glutamine-hydrolysing)
VCGICGFSFERRPDYDGPRILEQMADVIRHRGPDDHGYHIDGPVHLGHRRLSIIDLEGGKQPLSNEDGKVTIVYNGEVYNFAALKDDLIEKGHVFKTVSDTEVLVHLWEEVGTEMPSHLNGMFAFALWDAGKKELFLARDRMGQKPLYWTHNRDGLVFGSELRSLLVHPTVERRLDSVSLGKYMLFDSVPAPGSILEGVNKLEPGTWLLYKDGRTRTSRYWDISFPGKREKPPTFAEAKEELYERMRRSVERRMISDVPLGVFLSGGIDSSAVTALMCDLVGPSNVKTFSVGFANSSFDESEHASSVAKHFGTQHFSEQLEASTMMDLLPGIISRLDEPLADNSLIPTYFLSRFTREQVTVALGGDGGDELCLGYPTFKAHKIARWYGLLPGFIRSLIARLVETLPVSTDNISLDYQAKQFVRGMEYDPVARHFVWIGSVPPRAQSGLFTPDFMTDDPGRLLEDVARHASACTPRDDFDRLTYVYSKLYMCDDILTKVDRASMMHSLEARAPLLDPEVVDYLTSLPTRYKLRGFKMKHILKETFQGRLPDPILARKKKGFGVPVAEWLKGPLRPWVEELFSSASLKQHGVLSTPGVQRLWTDHLAGVRDNRKPLWSMVVLLLWMQENL